MTPRPGLDLQKILHAAAEIADKEGFEEITLSTLAQKLGVRSPSLYNHVEGLSGLRKKMAIYGVGQLTECMTRAAIGRERDNAVRAIGEAYVAFSREHPGVYEATLRAPDAEDDEYRKAASRLVELVVQVFRAYGLEENTAIHAVRGFRSLLHGFASLERNGGFGLPLDLDVSLRTMIDMYLAGLYSLSKKHAAKPG